MRALPTAALTAAIDYLSYAHHEADSPTIRYLLSTAAVSTNIVLAAYTLRGLNQNIKVLGEDTEKVVVPAHDKIKHQVKKVKFALYLRQREADQKADAHAA